MKYRPENQSMRFPVKNRILLSLSLLCSLTALRAQLSVDAELNALHNQHFVTVALSKQFANHFTLKLLGSYGDFGQQRVSAATADQSVRSPYTGGMTYSSLNSYSSSNIGFAYGIGVGYTGRINARNELLIEFQVQMYTVTDHFKNTPVSGLGGTKDWPEADDRVNHTNLSAGPALSHIIQLNDRISLCYGIKLPYYMTSPFKTAFGTNEYIPRNKAHVMAGLEPTVHTGIKYRLGK
jgi:hypothetical protein